MDRPWCFDVPRPPEDDGYWLKTRAYYEHSKQYEYINQWIPNRMSRECKHDGLYANCGGCKYER